jgi:multimeric flavodoxin WrbA
MKFVIFMGSPREKGNTATLLGPFMEELRRHGDQVHYIALRGKTIRGCKECFLCQKVMDGPGCSQRDDMAGLFPEILAADVIVLATPIFTWFCPSEMKALIDRCFSLSKKYNELTDKPMLLAGKKLVLITTYGDEAASGPDLLETAVKRLCAYAEMEFVGHIGVRGVNGLDDFTNDQAVNAAKKFAASLTEQRAQEKSWTS